MAIQPLNPFISHSANIFKVKLMQSDGRKGRDTYLCDRNTISFDFSTMLSGFICCWWICTGPEVHVYRLQTMDLMLWLHVPTFSLYMASVVNGVHSSGLNCYRTPAGCPVTVLPPRVHAARWKISPHDHAPRALGWLEWIWYDISTFLS